MHGNARLPEKGFGHKIIELPKLPRQEAAIRIDIFKTC